MNRTKKYEQDSLSKLGFGNYKQSPRHHRIMKGAMYRSTNITPQGMLDIKNSWSQSRKVLKEANNQIMLKVMSDKIQQLKEAYGSRYKMFKEDEDLKHMGAKAKEIQDHMRRSKMDIEK